MQFGVVVQVPPPPAAVPPPPAGPESTVVVSTTGIPSMTTIRLTLALDSTQSNVYSSFGTTDGTMSIPPAYQAAAPFGVDIGGASPAFFAVMAECEFDSWLTVGITTGDSGGALSSIGIDFDSWTETQGISASDGALFWMDPDSGPVGSDIVLAQLTVPTGSIMGGSAAMGVQGRSAGGADDWQSFHTWTFSQGH